MAPAEKLSELALDRNLLDSHFNGYKLSLSPIAVYKQDLEGIDVVQPSDDQYSFLHQKEFTLHNHLYSNIYERETVYYVDKNRKILKTSMNDALQFENPKTVWEIPMIGTRESGDYNLSICFPSETVAVLSDGAGIIYILDTSEKKDSWKVLHSYTVSEGMRRFKVIDSCVFSNPQRKCTCILRHVEPAKERENSDKTSSRFATVLKFITFTEEEAGWSAGPFQELRGPGSVEYSFIEPGGRAFYVASDLKFELPSNKQDMKVKESKEDDTPPVYFWRQGFEDVTVWFELAEEVIKSEVKLTIEDLSLGVQHKGETLLEGKLFLPVNSGLSTGSIKGNKIEIVLQKKEEKQLWRWFIDSPVKGKEIIDEEVVKEIHNRLASLCSEFQADGSTTILNSSQLEECDAFENDHRTLVRLDASTLECTHKILLGGQQWLLNLNLEKDKAPAFCLRNDVDGCVWQPESIVEGETWACNHVGTFLAFGYIQASKEQKKFTNSPPDMSYIAITDVTGHVMIYRKGIAVLGSLRNRKTGRRVNEIATQQLVNLHITGQVLGTIAEDKFLFILTSDKLHALHIQTD